MSWEYSDHPDRDSVTESCKKIQNDLIAKEDLRASVLVDTRPFHFEMFSQVVPAGFEGFAGSYRGSDYPYLKHAPVVIGWEDESGKYHIVHQGTSPVLVAAEMEKFHADLKLDLEKLSKLDLDTERKIILLAHILSKYVVVFLSIHPYANGNGHISRLIAWVIFLSKGFFIQNWDLDVRPEHPFDHCIQLYQQGDTRAMITYFYCVLREGGLPFSQSS